MNESLMLLAFTAATVGFVHTVLGPDHYLPFVMMAKAGKWSFRKTTIVTFLCGLGHVGTGAILGFIGIALGITIQKLVTVESYRGNIAAWLFISFGLVYFIWGLRRAYRNKPHTHFHTHDSNTAHTHEHNHYDEHSHVHEKEKSPSLTPWIMFTIFVLGPCEPLIPLIMYPAAKNSTIGVIIVTATFCIVTIITILTIVLTAYRGIEFIPSKKFERFTHAFAGGAILICGLAIKFLNL